MDKAVNKTNESWYPYVKLGSFFKLDNGVLVGCPMNADGTVGGFIEEAVKLLIEFAEINPQCTKEFELLRGKETCFGWEEPLLKFYLPTKLISR